MIVYFFTHFLKGNFLPIFESITSFLDKIFYRYHTMFFYLVLVPFTQFDQLVSIPLPCRLKLTLWGESLATMAAWIWVLPSVYSQVTFKFYKKTLPHWTYIWSLSRVRYKMDSWINIIRKCLFTYLHLYGFSPVCIIKWHLRKLCHTAPKCILKCHLSTVFCENA